MRLLGPVVLACAGAARSRDLEVLPFVLAKLGVGYWKVAEYQALRGEKCSERDDDEVLLDSECRVRRIKLQSRRLTGELVPEIALLEKIEELDLRDNGLTGSIPEEIADLEDLWYLDLSGNDFTGQIPAMPPKLFELYLPNNELTGPVDMGWLPNLEVLDLSGNQLTALPDFALMPQVPDVVLARNQMRGALHIEENDVLGHLDLEDNELSGGVEALQNCTALYYLNLAFNQLEGELPELPTGLSRLLLNNNQLSGEVPGGIGKLHSLERLELQGNAFSGRIPEELGDLILLQRLDLSKNRLTGPLPSLAKLRHLTSLRLSHNRLSGEVPGLEHLSSLQKLHLGHNDFHGRFPAGLCSMPSLESLHLRANRFEGELPRECFESEQLADLKELLLNDNLFSGRIPDLALPRLAVLTLHRNRFQGELPQLGPNLSVVTFHDNRLRDSIRELELRYSCIDDSQFRFHGFSCEDVAGELRRWRSWWHLTDGCGFFGMEYKVKTEVLLRHCPATCGSCEVGALKPRATFHANRLSCNLTTRAAENDPEVIALVIMGNMLGCGEKLRSDWILEEEQQEFLYFSAEKWKKQKKIAVLFLFLAILSMTVAKDFLHAMRLPRVQGSESSRIAEAYFQVLLITSSIACCSLPLLPVYLLSSTYYLCGQSFSRFTAAYFEGSISGFLVVSCWCCLAILFRLAALSFPKRVGDTALRRKTRRLEDTLAETVLAERPVPRTARAILAGLWHVFCWLLWFLVCFVISLPSILFAMAEALPNDRNYAWLLKLCHDLAPLMGVVIDLLVSKPLAALYSGWTQLRADRLSMRMKLCSEWLLPLLATALLHENCIGGWKKLFWQVCDAAVPDKHNKFNWMVFDELVLSAEEVCSFNLQQTLSGACSRSAVESLSVFLVEKAIFKALLPFALALAWKMVRSLLAAEARGCKLCCLRGALEWLQGKLVDRKNPIVQYGQLAALVETLIVWAPLVPLLTGPMLLAAATNLWLFETIAAEVPMESSSSLSRSFWVWSLRASWLVQVWYAFGTELPGRTCLLVLGVWVWMPSALWRSGLESLWPLHRARVKELWDRLMPKAAEQEMEMEARSTTRGTVTSASCTA